MGRLLGFNTCLQNYGLQWLLSCALLGEGEENQLKKAEWEIE